jgi:hypothetical protein
VFNAERFAELSRIAGSDFPDSEKWKSPEEFQEYLGLREQHEEQLLAEANKELQIRHEEEQNMPVDDDMFEDVTQEAQLRRTKIEQDDEKMHKIVAYRTSKPNNDSQQETIDGLWFSAHDYHDDDKK